MPNLKAIAESITTRENLKRISEDSMRFYMYNGKLKEIIETAIRKEFKKAKTVDELLHRIIPINFVRKIINKSSTVYMAPAQRYPINKKPADQDLLTIYEDSFNADQKLKTANRMFSLAKHATLEPFVDRYGIPRLRVMPSHTYSLYSDDPVQPESATHFIKHISLGKTGKDSRFGVWDDESYYLIDGEGNWLRDEQFAITKIDEPINRFGKIPFVHISEADDGNLMPIPDDDLLAVQTAIGVILTDQSFISKFQTFSAVAIKGAEADKEYTFSPNSIINLPEDGDIKIVKPEANIMEMIGFVEKLVEYLLITKNLKASDANSSVAGGNMSGLSKTIDEATTTKESRLDQQAYFLNAERELWELVSKNMIPVWIESDMLAPLYRKRFSDSFEIGVQFNEPKTTLTQKEIIDNQRALLDLGLTTDKLALMEIYPDKSDEEVEDLLSEIKKTKMENALDAMENFQFGTAQEGDDGDNQEEI